MKNFIKFALCCFALLYLALVIDGDYITLGKNFDIYGSVIGIAIFIFSPIIIQKRIKRITVRVLDEIISYSEKLDEKEAKALLTKAINIKESSQLSPITTLIKQVILAPILGSIIMLVGLAMLSMIEETDALCLLLFLISIGVVIVGVGLTLSCIHSIVCRYMWFKSLNEELRKFFK